MVILIAHADGMVMVTSKTVGLRRTQPFEFPKVQKHLGLHGRPAGKSLRPAGLRATFLYEPLGSVFVLKNFFDLRSCDTLAVSPSLYYCLCSIQQSLCQSFTVKCKVASSVLRRACPEAQSGIAML